MPVPLIAAAVRVAGGAVVRSAATKAATAKAVRVAATRYVRAAGRYMADAEKVGRMTRYGQMFVKAAKRTEHMAKELKGLDARGDTSSRFVELLQDSEKYLAKSARSRDARGNLLGETLLNGTMQGHRLFAVTRDIWEDAGYENRYDALKDAFGNKNLSEIILEIEEQTGVNLMRGNINSKDRYGTLTPEERMKVTNYIRENYGK